MSHARVGSSIMSPATSCMPMRLGLVLLVAMLLPRFGEGCFLTLRVVSAPPSSTSCVGSASVQGLTTRVSSPITACIMVSAAVLLVVNQAWWMKKRQCHTRHDCPATPGGEKTPTNCK